MTLKRPKDKGTLGENELVDLFAEYGIHLERTSPGLPYDLVRQGDPREHDTWQILATRPDRGRWLVSVDARAFAGLLAAYERYIDAPQDRIEMESKRYAKFSLHTIFESKFGGRS